MAFFDAKGPRERAFCYGFQMVRKKVCKVIETSNWSSFTHPASAQTIDVPPQSTDARGFKNTDFDLWLGKPEVSLVYASGAFRIYETWLDNGGTEEQAHAAYDSFYNNCMCAIGHAKYCS